MDVAVTRRRASLSHKRQWCEIFQAVLKIPGIQDLEAKKRMMRCIFEMLNGI